ncbi:MAG: tetratricopeptide repeat protein [Deltaproteobacteria bacterium]|nr:tetratricopeptide repeat protein [Deltaproteobacteria bacterium]
MNIFRNTTILTLAALLLLGCVACAQQRVVGQTMPTHCNTRAIQGAELQIPASPSLLYAKSESLLNSGDIAAATELLQRAVEIDDTSSYLWTRLGFAQWEQGEVTLAADALQRARQLGNDTEESLFLRALLHIYHREYAEAKSALQQVVQMNEENIRGLEILAGLHGQDGEYRDAILALDKIIMHNHHDMDAIHLRSRCFAAIGNFTSAIKDLEVVISTIKEESLYRELARLYRAQGDEKREFSIYEEGLKLFPESCLLRKAIADHMLITGLFPSGEAYLWKGEEPWCPEIADTMAILYIHEKRYLQAMASIKQLIAGEASDKGYYLKGLIHEALNEDILAREAYANIPNGSHFFIPANLRVAEILAQSSTDDAIKKVEEIIAASPKTPEAYLFLADIYGRVGQIQNTEATLVRALAIYPNSTEILYTHGFLLSGSGRTGEALTIMQQILLIDPRHCEALNFVGYHDADRGINLKAAQEKIEMALARCPEQAEILDSLGWVLFKRGKYEQALQYLQKAQERLPHERIVALHLAENYEKLGRYEAALAIYRQLLHGDAKDTVVQQKIARCEGKIAAPSSRKMKK